MKNLLVLLFVMLFVSPLTAEADVSVAEPNDVAQPNYDNQTTITDSAVIERIVLYIPNRILDILDIFRARVRVGPGFAVGARATEGASVYAGSYNSFYLGLPGPRLSPIVKSPIGAEVSSDIESGALSADADGEFGPNYSSTEIGAGVQAGIIGVDVAFDPVEIVDFIGGIFMFDPRKDDF